MLKHNHVFERFIDFENMVNGYKLARRNKRFRPEVLSYTAHLEDNLFDSIDSLKDRSYSIEGAHEFYEYFPKKRIITAWPFYNRVVNCAAYLALWPIYSKGFYEHSYGSIPGKGTLKAVNYIQYQLRKTQATGQYPWIGKADVAKFFFRIPHEVQIRELGKPLDDPDMMWFLETCIHGDGRPTGLPLEFSDVSEAERIFGIGMPVGSLISQMTANVVLNPIDHYMKRVVQTPVYVRYMDDMYLQGESKGQIWDALGMLDEKLKADFGLQLNQKTAVMPAKKGVEFVGRRITADRVTLRKSTSLQMKRHLKFVREHYREGDIPLDYAERVIQSYLGLMKHTDSDALRDKILKDWVLIRDSKGQYDKGDGSLWVSIYDDERDTIFPEEWEDVF